MSKAYRLNLLGMPELYGDDDTLITLRVRKHIALLVYLHIEGRNRTISRSRLCDLLWPGAPLKRARHSLTNGISQIRKVLGYDAVVTLDSHVRLQVDITTDVEPRMADSDPGTIPIPLEDLETCAGERFADWVELVRDRILTKIRSRLSEELAEARSHGRVDAVRERAELLYNVDPYSDSALQSLVGARLSSGDYVGAIRLLRRHGGDTETDLDFTPGADVQASLLRLERTYLSDTRTGAKRDPRLRGRLHQQETFVDRVEELQCLEGLMDQVANNQYRTCALRGLDGIGKSTLLRRFSLFVAAGSAPFYMVHCHEMGQSIPFAAVSDLIDQMCSDDSLRATDPLWLAEASRVAPAVKATINSVPEPPEAPPDTVRVRLAEAIKRMLEAVADEKPVVLVFDDMHYMDPASRDVLHILSRKFKDSAVLLVGVVRRSENESKPGDVDGLRGVEWQETIDLGPLDDTSSADLVSALSAETEQIDDAVKKRIVELAQGNPLLTELLVMDLHSSGAKSLVLADMLDYKSNVDWTPPNAIESVFTRQYAGLSRCAERLVHLLATAGRSIPLEEMCTLLAVTNETVDEAVLLLIERSIVVLGGNALDFRNDLHRAYAYSTMPKEARKYHHAHLAQHLRAAKDQSEFQHALEASHHFLKAEWFVEATELACLGADRAITCGAPKEAVKALEAVFGTWPDDPNIDIAILLAQAYSAQGLYEQSKCTLQQIRSMEATNAQTAQETFLWAEALHRGRLAEDDGTIISAARQAVVAATKTGDHRLVMKTQQIAAEVAHEAGTWDVLEIIEAECARLTRQTHDTEVEGLTNLTLGYCRMAFGDPATAADHFARSAERFRTLRLDASLHRAFTGLGISESNIGSFEKAHDAFECAGDAAARAGDIVANTNALQNLGSLSNELGRFSQAARYFRSAIDLDTDISTSRVSTALYCNAANLSLAIGNYEEARTFLKTATTAANRSQLWHHFVNVHLTGADIHLAKGEHKEACKLVKDALALTGNRYRLLPDLGQYWRLRRHYYSAAGIVNSEVDSKLMKVAHVLELNASDEWCTQQDQRADALDELARLGLFGVVARLAAVGVRYGRLSQVAADMSGAETVQAAFPHQQWEAIPISVLS